jgi:hypothetical protein
MGTLKVGRVFEIMCRWNNTQLFKDGEGVQCVQGVYRLRRSNIRYLGSDNIQSLF